MPDSGHRLPIDDLDAVAKRLDYARACECFKVLKESHPSRPADLPSMAVMDAWMAVLAIEARLLHHARILELGEGAAYRMFIRARGRGIPPSPKWLRRIEEGALDVA